jgi:hypothetical protein
MDPEAAASERQTLVNGVPKYSDAQRWGEDKKQRGKDFLRLTLQSTACAVVVTGKLCRG